MRISKQDLTRLSMLRRLCVTVIKETLEWGFDGIDWADGKMCEWLRDIGTVSTWLSDEFKEATNFEITWGFVAMLQYTPDDSGDYIDRKLLYQIATNDLLTLILACAGWLQNGDPSEGDAESKTTH